MARRRRGAREGMVTIRFTGAAGADSYTVDDGEILLEKGDMIDVVPEGHWWVLLKSGNAEIVEDKKK